MVVKGITGRNIHIEVRGEYDDDLQISEAYYLDSDDEVSDEELDFIEKTYAQEMYEDWYEGLICAAEYHYEDR